MSTKTKTEKSLVSLGISGIAVPKLILNTRHYVTNMTGNAVFPNPTPPLATITTQVNLLETNYNISVTRVKGSVAAMRTTEKQLLILIKGLAAYVETIANADPENALKIISEAGMEPKKTAARPPKKFSLTNGKLSGTVVINDKAVVRGTYLYQMTTDPNTPASWVQVYAGGNVKFTKTGLTTGTRYYFRAAISVKGIQGNWSAPLDILVQ
jgi:hypothetical protein